MCRLIPEKSKEVLQAAFVVVVGIIMGVLVFRYLKITSANTMPELIERIAPTLMIIPGHLSTDDWLATQEAKPTPDIVAEVATHQIRLTETASQQSFDDVPPDHWAYEEIEFISSHGITVGCSYDPPLYCPDRTATRAELAVMLSRILEIIELGGE